MKISFAMQSIFWRIFIWFWIFSFSVSALVILTVYFTADSMPPPAPEILPGKMLDNMAILAKTFLEQNDKNSLEKVFASMSDSKAQFSLHVDSDLPPIARDHFASNSRSSLLSLEENGKMLLFKQIHLKNNDACYIFFSGPLFKGLFRTFFFDRLFWLRITLVLLFAALMCYLLARTIVKPLIALKSISSQLGQQDLKSRPDENLLKRKDEIGEVSRDFHRMAERVEALVKNQQDLLHEISHELKSPLARLQLTIETISGKNAINCGKEFRRIEMETGRLKSLVEQILLVARLDEGIKGQSQLFSSSDLLFELIDDLRIEADAKGQSIILQEKNILQISSHRNLIARAVENIMRNAIIQSPPGSALELVSEIEEDEKKKYWRIEVIDNGPGIPENHISEALQPFTTVGSQRRRTGSGLGLSIVARIVKELDAKIELKNIQKSGNTGLKVTICFPARDC